jgi:hypothetical protein
MRHGRTLALGVPFGSFRWRRPGQPLPTVTAAALHRPGGAPGLPRSRAAPPRGHLQRHPARLGVLQDRRQRPGETLSAVKPSESTLPGPGTEIFPWFKKSFHTTKICSTYRLLDYNPRTFETVFVLEILCPKISGPLVFGRSRSFQIYWGIP